MAYKYSLFVNGKPEGPYERRTIVGMRVKKMITSDQLVWRDDGAELSVAELLRETEPIILDKKACRYSHFADQRHVWIDSEGAQYEVEAENMGDTLETLELGMAAELVLYEGRVILAALPTHVENDSRAGEY